MGAMGAELIKQPLGLVQGSGIHRLNDFHAADLTAIHSKMMTVCIGWRGKYQDTLNGAVKYGDPVAAHYGVIFRQPGWSL
jgi:hypothetical protein